jgi:hypothetical protein
VSGPSGGLGDVRLVLDTSALLGYASNRPGIVELIECLDGDLFAVPLRCVARAIRLAPSAAPAAVRNVQRIADHPACQLVPEPSAMADLHADYASFYEREDLAAAMVLAIHLGCALGTYEAASYAVGGQVLNLVIGIKDGWKE